jgi:proteasome accessory factor B
LQRIVRIHAAIQSGKFPNASGLSREFEVSTKTLHRDLEFMRSQLSLPIEYDRAKFGFYYTEDVAFCPALQISEGELLALVVAEKAVEQYRGTSFEKPLLSAIRKLEAALPDTISIDLGDIQQAISFRTRAEPIIDLGIFNTLAKAAADRAQIAIGYRKPGQAAPERRVIDPYHLANINGEWFLFAFDHLRNDIRTFVPARMKSIEKTGKTFARPQRFSIEKRLRDSFGVHSGQGQHRVVIRFDRAAADYIREKKWHPSQKIAELPDGGVELQMRLSSLVEVGRWVLSWGGSAVAIQPGELVQALRDSAKKIVQALRRPQVQRP